MLRGLAGAADLLSVRESLAIFAQLKAFYERDLMAIVEGVRFDDLCPILPAGRGIAATTYTAFRISSPTAAPPSPPIVPGFRPRRARSPIFLS
jgi:hypothetical protein